jgi:SET domain-containing protein
MEPPRNSQRPQGGFIAAASFCVCTTHTIFTCPIVEVKQYGGLDGDHLTVNRGVQTLERIKQGTMIDEYVGDIIPNGEGQDAFGDQDYGFALYGQPQMKNGYEEFEDGAAIVAAVENGNWTRYVNHVDNKEHNVEFVTVTIANKIRIVLIARRDIHFGEELKIDYGKAYWRSKKKRA